VSVIEVIIVQFLQFTHFLHQLVRYILLPDPFHKNADNLPLNLFPAFPVEGFLVFSKFLNVYSVLLNSS